MKSIYILAPYPGSETLRDGMFQRIATIDGLLEDYKRVYINIGVKNPMYKKVIYSDKVEEFFFNPFYPISILTKFLLRASVIYAHSIHHLRHIPYCFHWMKQRKVTFILDVHGVVPEEMKMYGKYLQSRYLRWIERKAFRVLDDCICVSNEMIKHFTQKYPNSPAKYHLLFTSNLMPKPDENKVKELSRILGIKPTDCVIMYCGNTQRWQNISLMIETIRKLDKAHIKFIILSGDTENFKALLDSAGLDSTNIILMSVSPSELNNYYALAHYGFILRDDMLINRVSNPTKMLEYLQFGLIPIVLSPFIGDYFSLEYEYVNVIGIGDFDFAKKKSMRNVQLAIKMYSNNKLFDIHKLIN